MNKQTTVPTVSKAAELAVRPRRSESKIPDPVQKRLNGTPLGPGPTSTKSYKFHREVFAPITLHVKRYPLRIKRKKCSLHNSKFALYLCNIIVAFGHFYFSIS